MTHKKYIPLLFLLGVFALSRAVYYLMGVRFNSELFPPFWHSVDVNFLVNDLWNSLFYLHTQPPFLNGFVGVVYKLFPKAQDRKLVLKQMTGDIAAQVDNVMGLANLAFNKNVLFNQSLSPEEFIEDAIQGQLVMKRASAGVELTGRLDAAFRVYKKEVKLSSSFEEAGTNYTKADILDEIKRKRIIIEEFSK